MNVRRFSLTIAVLVVIVAAAIGIAHQNASAATVCSPATAISVPYAKDGVGDICVVATSLCSYINSWNLTTLDVNGTSYLNTYVAASSVAPLNGSYTIHYVSTVAWGHFEIAGTCGAPQPTATTPPATIPPTTGPSLTPTTGPSLTPLPGASATKTNTPITPTVTPVSGSTLSINAGGSATGSFTADQYYSGGTAYTNTNTIDVSQVGSVPAAVFQSERYGAFSYTIPNRSGAQTVTLYFAETYLTAAGQRLFNVSINGATVLSSFDIYASAGGQNKAIAKTFNTTANSSGQVVIQFTTGTENPKVNGISVTGSGSTPTAGPSLTATHTPTQVIVVNTPTRTPTQVIVPTNTPTGGYLDNLDSYNTGLFTKADGWTNGSPFNVGWRADHINFSGGIMTITLDNAGCPSGCSNTPYASSEYRSNKLTSYGLYEARFKAAKASGTVSSFFTYTGSSDNQPWDEIDFEVLGKNTTQMQLNYFTNGTGGHETIINLGFDASAGFHTYGIEYRSTYIKWFVDGALVHTETGSRGALPSHTMKMMMNLWPGIGVDSWLGAFSYTGPLSHQFDWVKYTP